MNNRQFSSKQEIKVAELLDGKVVSNSGATKFNKGDVIVKSCDLLIECKTCTTSKDSFSVKKEWLEKLKEEAYSQGLQNYGLAIDFGDSKNYFIIDTNLMINLVNYIRQEMKEKENG